MKKEALDVKQISYRALNELPEAVIWFDKKGKILEINNTACSFWGYDREELLKLTIFDINPTMRPEIWDAHWQQKQRDNSTFESTHKRKNGETFPVDITDHFFKIEEVIYGCAIVRNISTRKQKEAALRGALVEIKELKEKLEAENNYLQQEIELQSNFGEIIGVSPAFKKVLKKIEQVADTNSTVLITGESGTGKELIARALHQLSQRSQRPMIKVNCAALPANLIESELFGHVKGAFTGAISDKTGKFELANGGTLFLDEIGEIPIELQPKLLRALQEGEIEPVGGQTLKKLDVRIVAATNRDLEKEIEEGNFREDLYYRLNVFPIHSIPLRKRKEDIPYLVQFFCEKIGGKLGRKITNIPQKLIDQLLDYDFPGNIRELENLIERGIITSKSGKLKLGEWFMPKKKRIKKNQFVSLEEVQKKYIIDVLKHTEWRVSGSNGAAKILDMRPTTLYSKMDRLGIKRSVDTIDETD